MKFHLSSILFAVLVGTAIASPGNYNARLQNMVEISETEFQITVSGTATALGGSPALPANAPIRIRVADVGATNFDRIHAAALMSLVKQCTVWFAVVNHAGSPIVANTFGPTSACSYH